MTILLLLWSKITVDLVNFPDLVNFLLLTKKFTKSGMYCIRKGWNVKKKTGWHHVYYVAFFIQIHTSKMQKWHRSCFQYFILTFSSGTEFRKHIDFDSSVLCIRKYLRHFFKTNSRVEWAKRAEFLHKVWPVP